MTTQLQLINIIIIIIIKWTGYVQFNMHWVKENKIANGVSSVIVQRLHTGVP